MHGPYRLRPLSLETLRPFALAVLSGVLYFVGFVGFDQWYLSWICLVPVLFALQDATVTTWKRALAVSWLFGLTTHLGGYYWIVTLLQTFAHLHVALSVLGYLLLCIAQGACLGAFGLLTWVLSRRTGHSVFALAAVTMVAVELCFPMLFPSYLANSQAWMPYTTQIADLGGVLLVTFVITLVNGGVGELLAARLGRRPLSRPLVGAAAFALVFTVGYSAVRLRQLEAVDAASPKLKTAIVQANVGAGDKFANVMAGIQRFKDMSDEAMNDPAMGLVVWPESAFNRSVRLEPGLNLTGAVATTVKVPMVVGVVRVDRKGGEFQVWNSALALRPGGEVAGSFDKTMLLAFGEYVPGDKWFPGIYKLLPYSGHFERGESVQPLPVGPYKLSTDICYEDILPRFIHTLMVPIDEAGNRPHAMVNITNDSWYGPAEPPIHLALATFRAIEHRRWLVRSTATGISAFIDSAGRIVDRTHFEVAETLTHEVPMITGGPTVYGVMGDWVGYLAVALCLAGLYWKRLRAAAPGAR